MYSTHQFFILVPSPCLVLRDNENRAKKITQLNDSYSFIWYCTQCVEQDSSLGAHG